MLSTLVITIHIAAALGTLATGCLVIGRGAGAAHASQITAAYASLWCGLFISGLVLGWDRAGISLTETLSAAGFGCIGVATYASITAERTDRAWRRLPPLAINCSFALLVAATLHQALGSDAIRFSWWAGALLSIAPACALLASTYRVRLVRAH